MKCKNCGYYNPHRAKFCGKCGFRLSNATPLVFGVVLASILLVIALLGLQNWTDRPYDPPSISSTATQKAETIPIRTEETVHVHSWRSATCTAPKRCTTCGAESGVAAGHKWQPATYDQPKTCSICAITTGSPLNPLSRYEVGEQLAFGSYEQDGYNGNGIELIGWRVLAKETDKMLVISELGLESRRYHRQNTSVDWDECSLRSWLNGNFYDAAFSAEEKSQILATTVEGSSSKDNLFLLSCDEAEMYFSGNNDRVCYATRSALNQGAYASPHNGGSWWLLRTPGKNSRYVMSINTDGSIDYDGGRVSSDYGVVRPAMWLDISN